MIQDIYPKAFKNEYIHKSPTKNSIVICWSNDKILISDSKSAISYPEFSQFNRIKINFIFLFAIDEEDFFLADFEEEITLDGFVYVSVNALREAVPNHLAFAGITAHHLKVWYKDNQFCGRCKSNLTHSHSERMLFCDKCNNMVYPQIAPVVIVALTNGDEILLTQYANRQYKKEALIAGFIEIGETPEEAVKREIMEEVGLKAKNITYFKSQPWGYSQSLLLGFFAQLDGESKVKIDKQELATAFWVNREDLNTPEDELSLTYTMIKKFKDSFLFKN
ncbi:NADH pyrophosphatase [Clostridia bacterium]|nr:NADH pyrophosphatase [Clostridia bacterium]